MTMTGPKTITRGLAALGAALLLSGCAGGVGSTPSGVREVGREFSVRPLRFRNTDTRIHYYTAAFEKDGKLEICGAVKVRKPNHPFGEMLIDKTLDKTEVKVDGKTVIHGVRFVFAVETDKGMLRPKSARCVVTDTPWTWKSAPKAEVFPPRTVTYGS